MGIDSLERTSARKRLDSWKSIAEYLGRSCRTVQRWHREYNLPARRLGGSTGAIFAYSDELDSWLSSRGPGPEEPAPESGWPPQADDVSDSAGLQSGEQHLHGSLIPHWARTRSARLTSLAWKMTEEIPDDPDIVVRLFREAIDLDRNNASAHAGWATLLVVQGWFGRMRLAVAYKCAQASVDHALQLDSELPQVKSAAALLKIIVTREWQDARRLIEQALAPDGSWGAALRAKALLHIAEGDLSGAAELSRKAAGPHPLSISGTGVYFWSKYLAHDFEKAFDEIEEARASGRAWPFLDAVEALVLTQLWDRSAYIERIQALAASRPNSAVVRGALGYLYGMMGRTAQAREIAVALSSMESAKQDDYAIALVLIGLGDTEEAVSRLEQSFRQGALWSLGFQSDPILASLRGNPEFDAFMNKLVRLRPLSHPLHPLGQSHGPQQNAMLAD